MSRRKKQIDLTKPYGSYSQSGWDKLTEKEKTSYIKSQTKKRATNVARAYGTIRISPTVVAGYRAGRYSADTLMKNIEKNNPKELLDQIQTAPGYTWQDLLKEELRNGDFESMISLTRTNSFYTGDYTAAKGIAASYKGSMNDAFHKLDKDDPSKQELLIEFGREINFMEWEYSSATKSLTIIQDGFLWEVHFRPGWQQGEYGIGADVLVVTKQRIAG